ncbi:MAG: hypothetical protein LBC63_03635 [Holophagales bacterium]|jgi:hypothetical protein|nr:hypothetical protein [Holophagales bacterium]
MRNRPVRALLPTLFVCCVCTLSTLGVALDAQGGQGPQQANSQEQLDQQEQMVFNAIRNANKSIHVVAPKPIPESIAAELIIKYKLPSETFRTNNKIDTLEVMTADSQTAARFSKAALVWVNPKYANEPEMLIIDESIILKNFTSPSRVEAIDDPTFAKHRVSELKKNRKSSEKIGLSRKHEEAGWGCFGELLRIFGPVL